MIQSDSSGTSHTQQALVKFKENIMLLSINTNTNMDYYENLSLYRLDICIKAYNSLTEKLNKQVKKTLKSR